MRRSIILLLLLYYFNIAMATDNYQNIENCNYIGNRTDSVEIFCALESDHNANMFNATDQENICYQNLFKNNSKFKNRLNVKLLKLSFYCIHIHSYTALSEMFPRVHQLDISYLSQWMIGQVPYQQFKYLNKLNGSGNLFEELPTQSFNNMPNLLEIDFSHNNITQLNTPFAARMLIDENTQLSTIDLSHNKIRQILASDFDGLTQLTELDLSYNHIYHIDVNSFDTNAYLKVLRLNNNSLTTFDCHVFTPLKNLKLLTFTFDIISSLVLDCVGCSIDITVNNTNEIEIDLSGITTFTLNKNSLKNLGIFTMGKNAAKNVTEIIEMLPTSLRQLDLSSNNLKDQSVNIINRFDNLEALYLRHSNLTELKPNMFLRHTSLGVLDLSNNNLIINNVTDLFAPMKNLYAFIVSNAHLDNIPEILQALPSKLMILDLSFNYVGRVNNTTFQRFTNLVSLNLSHTNLSNFGFQTFYHQTNLEYFNLSFNGLIRLNFTKFVRNFRELHTLNLEGNGLSNLSTINPIVFPSISSLAISKNGPSCQSLTTFIHQWPDKTLISNPSKRTHIHGIDCNLEKEPQTDSIVDMILMPFKTDTIIKHAELLAIIFSVLFWILGLMCGGYLMMKFKIIRVVIILDINRIYQRATSISIFARQEIRYSVQGESSA